MGLIWTILGLAPLSYGARLAARSGFRTGPGWPTSLGAFVVAWVWVTLGMLLLGHAGLIARGPIVGWSVLGLAVGLWMARSRPADYGDAPDARTPLGLEVALALALAAWLLVSVGSRSLVLPVKVNSDGPIYHLLFAARWWKAGRIFLVPTPFGENAAPYFPAVGELWMTWLFTLWGGDRLEKMAQVPFLFAAAGAAYATARRLGSGRSASALATILLATVVPLVLFTFEPNVDTIFVAGYSLAAYFFLLYRLGDAGFGSLALGALAAGGAWGTKAPGVVFVPTLLAIVAISLLVRPGSPRKKGIELASLVFLPLVMEGYWLARNAWLTGNPLYPLHVQIGGLVLLRGWYGPDAMPSSPYYIPVSDWRSLVDILLSVFDPRLVPLWALALLNPFFTRGRDKPNRTAIRLFALGMIVNILLYWLVIPYRTQQRFLFHALALGVVPLAAFLDRGKALRWLAVVLLAIHLLIPLHWPWPTLRWYLTPFFNNLNNLPAHLSLDPGSFGGGDLGPLALLIPIGCLALGWAWVRSIDRRSLRLALGSVVASGLIVALQAYLILPGPNAVVLRRFPAFRDYLPAWIDLDLRTRREPARIAYAGTNLPYYLMGPEFQNDVFYINVDAHRDWLLHDYHRAARSLGQPDPWPDTRPGWDRLAPDFDAWLANLRAERMRLLVVARANPNEGPHNLADRDGFTIERVWADAHPDLFVPIYGAKENDPQMRIYALRPPETRAPGP